MRTHRNATVLNASSGRVRFDRPTGDDALVASLTQLRLGLSDPAGQARFEAALETNPEVASLVERMATDLERLDQLERFARADRAARKYGMTSDQFWDLMREQNWSCAVCSTEFRPEGPRMNVDHNHDTGEVRGLLCGNCNRGLGLFKDSPDALRAAIDYLTTRGHYGPSGETK